MTSAFVPIWGRVGILLIGLITDLSVLWHLWIRVEKGQSQLFIPNHLSCEHVNWINLYLHLMYFYFHFIFIKISNSLH